MSSQVMLRPVTAADLELVWRIHYTGLGGYVAEQFGTDREEQRAYFERHFDATNYAIVVAGAEDVGVLAVDHRGDHLYLSNVVLLPGHQGRGIGTELVGRVQAQAAGLGVPVRLRVFKVNRRACALYERLGFIATGQAEEHVLMMWEPAGTAL